MVLTQENEFDRITEKVARGENFCLLRYGDGEQSIMTGREVHAQEGWVTPSGRSRLGDDLLACYARHDDKVVQAISCLCCDPERYYWFLSNSAAFADITFANLFCNSQYRRFQKFLNKLERPVVLIVSDGIKNQDIRFAGKSPLRVLTVKEKGVETWAEDRDAVLDSLRKETAEIKDAVFLISAGPMAGVIALHLQDHNPDNCYLDVGSSLDEVVYLRRTRPYMKPRHEHAKRRCQMISAEEMRKQITVVIGVYGRPDYLVEQVRAIQNQSFKPYEIIVFKDHNEAVDYQIPDEIKDDVTLVSISRNVGVWGRFAAPLFAKTPYVCLFDDDTIPGRKWLQNCYETIQHKRGLLGTNGVIFSPVKGYKWHERVGWAKPNRKTRQVDIVGHSWFFEREWVSSFWASSGDFSEFRIVGEDIHFAHMLQRYHSLRVYVPPHPPEDEEMFGSLPEKARRYGADNTAISISDQNIALMGQYLDQARKNGYRLMLKSKLHRLVFRAYRKLVA